MLLPRERPKTPTALAWAEPLVKAQAAPVQRLQRFVSESRWDADAITAQGALIIDVEAVFKYGTNAMAAHSYGSE